MKTHGFTFFSDKNQLEQNTQDLDVVIQNCGYYTAQNASFDFNRYEDAYLMIYQNPARSKRDTIKGGVGIYL